MSIIHRITKGFGVSEEHKPLEHTFDAVLARSAPIIGQRVGDLDKDHGLLFADREAKSHGGGILRADAEAKRTHFLNLKESGADPAAVAAAEKDWRGTQDLLTGATAKEYETIATYEAVNDLVRDCRRYIGSRKHEEQLDLVPVTLDTGNAGPWVERIAVAGAVLADKRDVRERRAKAVQPADLVKRQLHAKAATVAEQGAITVRLNEHGAPAIEWPTIPAPFEPSSFLGKDTDLRLNPRMLDMEGLAMRYFGDKIVSDLDRAIDEVYATIPPEDIMDPVEKRRLLRALDAEIDRHQRELAEIIWQARADGHHVFFPSGLPARAVLGIA